MKKRTLNELRQVKTFGYTSPTNKDTNVGEDFKDTIKILEDLIKNHSISVCVDLPDFADPRGELVVHTETIKEIIEELKQ